MLPMFGTSFNTATLAPSLHLAPPCTSSPSHSLTLMMDSRIANQWRHKCNSNMYSGKLNTGDKGWSFTVVRFWLATLIHSLVTTKILEVHLQISCRQTQLQCPSIDFDFCTKVLFTQKIKQVIKHLGHTKVAKLFQDFILQDHNSVMKDTWLIQKGCR